MTNFDIVSSICPKYYWTLLSWKIEIKIEKVIYFTQPNLNFFALALEVALQVA